MSRFDVYHDEPEWHVIPLKARAFLGHLHSRLLARVEFSTFSHTTLLIPHNAREARDPRRATKSSGPSIFLLPRSSKQAFIKKLPAVKLYQY